MPRKIDRLGLLTFFLAMSLVAFGLLSLADDRRPKVIACSPPKCYILRYNAPSPPPPPKKELEI